MRDSYQNFFNHFNINFQNIIDFGVEIDTIYPEPERIESEWRNLIHCIESNQEVYIRGYGRDAHGTKMYQELYKMLLGNENIKKDPTNNSHPTRLLQKVTGYSKIIKKDNSEKERISNYQITHIFGQTKNPFLFTAPWNIVWKSKILDPFTGHESKGRNTDLYKTAFTNKVKRLYSKFIKEYNDLALKYFSSPQLNDAFETMHNRLDIDEKTFEKFKSDATNELKIII